MSEEEISQVIMRCDLLIEQLNEFEQEITSLIAKKRNEAKTMRKKAMEQLTSLVNE